MPIIAVVTEDYGSGIGLGIFIGFLATAIFFGYVASRRRAARLKKPRLIGSFIPELGAGFDIAKRYDVTCGGSWDDHATEKFENVRILGYVGNEQDEFASKMYMRGRWLVVEFVDGRKAYLQPHLIKSLREAVA